MLDDRQLEHLPAPDLLRWAIQTYGDKLALVTSFQKTGMVILDIASRISTGVRVFTIDTGRLPDETYQVMDTVRSRYGFRIEVVLPDPAELAGMVARHGPNPFYESVELRQLCCEIRKVRPLERALAGFDAWVTGLRRSQSDSRAAVPKAERLDGRLKLSPLADWSGEQVEDYIQRHDVPLHPLYARGYTSIGCAPCTRPVAEGEDERAGRWWWEQDALKECGIHFSSNGKVQRGFDVAIQEVLNEANA